MDSIPMDSVELQRTDIFEYLDSTITSDGGFFEIKHRCAAHAEKHHREWTASMTTTYVLAALVTD